MMKMMMTTTFTGRKCILLSITFFLLLSDLVSETRVLAEEDPTIETNSETTETTEETTQPEPKKLDPLSFRLLAIR